MDDCFGSFAVTTDIRTLKWFGEGGFIRYGGLIGLIIAFGSLFGALIFVLWRYQRVRVVAEARTKELAEEEMAWKEKRRLEIAELEEAPAVVPIVIKDESCSSG